MRQMVKPGGVLDALTPVEAEQLLEAKFRREVETIVRAAGEVPLDATGSGIEELYTVPLGFEFEVRRVTFDLDTAADPGTGNVVLGAGHTVEYLRSRTRIEWAQPTFGASVQVPGVQTWGKQQGPYLRNGEVFEVRAVGLTAAARLIVQVQGILRRPPGDPKNRAAA